MQHQAMGLEGLLRAISHSSRPAQDQASGLATNPNVPIRVTHATQRRCRTIAIAAGKGGVGKSSISVNLGTALSMAGKDVILLDADMGLANVDVLLGLTPSRHLGHLLDGACTINDLLLKGPHGLRVVPAGSGTRRLAHATNAELAAVIGAFDELPTQPDYLLVDTAAGVGDSVALFAAAADDVLLVVCDEPASLTDAYALLKVLSRDFGVKRFQMVSNMVGSAMEARAVHQKLDRVASRFLDVRLDYLGCVPRDERLRQAIRRQKTIVDAEPRSPSGAALNRIAEEIVAWGVPTDTSIDRVTFFSSAACTQAGV